MRIQNFFAILVFISLPMMAHAILQVFPLRVVLSDVERNAQISLRHKGKTPMKYRITTVFYQMGSDGSMKALDKSEKQSTSADGLFRYSPKQVSLEPDVEQVVRLSLRMPANTADGEYRLHLHFEEEEAVPESLQPTNENENKMNLKAKMAVAIPVVVRKGNPQAKISLENLKLIKTPEQKYAFSVDLKREGSAIAYGDFEIHSIAASGAVKVVGTVNGLSSYIDQRVVSYPLNDSPVIPGKLKVFFKKPVSEGNEILATTETELK